MVEIKGGGKQDGVAKRQKLRKFKLLYLVEKFMKSKK